jgi:hypothetical protein
MFVSGRVRPSKPSGLRRDRITNRIIRKTLPLSKSLGPIFYLVSVGAIAIWVIGVFFGVGFFFLMPHHSEKVASHLGIGSTHLGAFSVESHRILFPQLSEAAPDQIVAALDKEIAGYGDRRRIGRAEQIADPNAAAPEDHPLSADLRTDPRMPGELSLALPPPSQPFDAIEPSNAAQLPQAVSSHKPHQDRPTNTRTSQPHAPVQAIQDLLQKQPQLLK